MPEGPEVLLSAHVTPVVAFVLVRDFADTLRALEAKGRNLIAAGTSEAAGRELLRSAAEIRAAGLSWQHWMGSASGTSEVPTSTGAAVSAVSSFPPGMTTRQVADRLRVSTRRVTDLVRGGRLAGHLVGGRWVVDEVSVAEELDRRRSA